jgi:phytoene synthase
MNVEIELCYQYNKQLLKYYSKSFYIATLLLPRNKRKAVFALYGFCRFVDNLVDNPRNRSKEEIKDEIYCMEKELKIAYRSNESQHAVICAFIQVAKKYQIPIEYPSELFKGVLMDVDHQHYKDFDELQIFCYRVAGVVGLMMVHILGYTHNNTFEYAEKLGIAMQLTNILRDIREDKNNGRIYLPVDEMKRFNIQKKDILHEQYTPMMKDLIKFSIDRAHRYYKEAQPGIKMLPKECQFAIYSASYIYRNILNEIERNDYNPFKGRVYVSQAKKIKIILWNYLRGKINLSYKTT